MSTVTPSSAYFEGHFPERPILPGVALLAIVLEALAPPVALRAIPFARLRRPVVPGDALALAVRAGDRGHVRFDVRCDGALVANGELILGRPDETDSAAARVARASPAAGAARATAPPVASLVPQQPPMRFVTSIVEEAPDGLTCTAQIPAACALVAEGTAPALVALEAAAQTAAAWEAMRRWREASTASPRMGYLVAVRDVIFFADRIPADETLRASARLEAAALPLTHYAVEVVLGVKPILRGTIATVLADEPAN